MGFLFLALSSLLFALQFDLISSQTHVYDFCDTDNSGANYTANSTFQANLNLLLSSTSNNTNQFYNNTVGRSPDRVYGLFQCRGDYSSQDCSRCAQTASEAITVNCPHKKDAVILYDECWLHYSGVSFVSTVLFDPTVYLSNVTGVSDSRFTPTLDALMDRLVMQAVSNASSLFAVGENNFTTSQKLFGLVQCTRDLSASDCNRCLTRAVSEFPGCCDKKIGGRVVKPSCNARYETYEFFQFQAPPRGITLPSPNNTTGQGKKSSKNILVILLPTVIGALVLSVIPVFFCLRRKKGNEMVNCKSHVESLTPFCKCFQASNKKMLQFDEISSVESLQFNLSTIVAATNNFSDANRLGEGGFGAVYKGTLLNGKQIAVKRLSRHSGQGVEEFKNEVFLLARLQHRNLVRLYGFCLEGAENILIYEFVPNSSLDKFIFDSVNRTLLDWESRYKIIKGIARGLLYLHEDSRDRIIHRDLKASNVLLDAQMNPKISDFGMARLFVVDQTQGSTKRVVGTYGYMSPEYAVHGRFSVKSDVFSFGVLVLEIITGRKNSSFFYSEHAEDLLSYAWRLWRDGAPLDLLDPACKEHSSENQVTRCIQMGLLCVQEDPARRPTMVSVAVTLNRNSVALPSPFAPAFFVKSKFDMRPRETGTTEQMWKYQSVSSSTPCSVNESSMLYPR